MEDHPAAAQAANGRRPRVSLMGLTVDCVREADAIGWILDELEQGRGGWAITPNLDQLRQFHARPEVRPLFAQADLVVADGMPLVWASRLQGTPLPQRIAGSELVWSLTAEATLAGMSIYMLGDVPAACALARRQLTDMYPAVRIAGAYSPPLGFDHDPAEIERIRDRLVDARPDIVYVALGFPKQEWLIAQLRESLPAAWLIGVGASLSFLGGRVRRAPEWMTRSGLEWAHRLAQEPRRLAKRYLVHGIPFALRLFANALVTRARRRGRPPAPIPAPARARRVVFARGAIERERADVIAELLERE